MIIKDLKFYFDEQFKKIGVKDVAFACLENVDNSKPLPNEFSVYMKEVENSVKLFSNDEIENNHIFLGYNEMIRSINRSIKKFPPSVKSLIDIIKKRQLFPKVNSVVDIYNTEAIKSFLSLGVHDLDKITGNTISFKVIKDENQLFYPIGGGEKRVNVGDYVYTDQNTILAWLDARDSDLVKVNEKTKDILIVVQGNINTTLDYRINSLKNICNNIQNFCGGHSLLVQ